MLTLSDRKVSAMSERFPCGNIDCRKFGAVVWEDSEAQMCSFEGKTYDLRESKQLVMVAAFLNFDHAVNFDIEQQEKADAYCKANGYTNKGKIWAERTSGHTLAGDH